MEYPTPRILELSLRLVGLMSDLQRDIDRLHKRLGVKVPDDYDFHLNAGREHIVDRRKEKQKLRRQWRVALHEILRSDITDIDTSLDS